MKRIDAAASLPLPREQLAALLARWGVRRALLFGSAIHGELRPDSDLDLLVDFKPERIPGLGFFELEHELSALLGRRVDLNTFDFLSPYFRKEVLAEAQVVYDATR